MISSCCEIASPAREGTFPTREQQFWPTKLKITGFLWILQASSQMPGRRTQAGYYFDILINRITPWRCAATASATDYSFILLQQSFYIIILTKIFTPLGKADASWVPLFKTRHRIVFICACTRYNFAKHLGLEPSTYRQMVVFKWFFFSFRESLPQQFIC